MEIALRYFYEVSKFLSDNPALAVIAVNISLGLMLWLSILISKKFVVTELRKIRKVHISQFDRVIIIFAGVVCSIVLCIVGTELLIGIAPYKIANDLIAVLVMFASLATFIKSLTISDLFKIKSPLLTQSRFPRITAISFVILAVASALMEEMTDPKIKLNIANVFSYLTMIYYFIEEYIYRKEIIKCFTIEKCEEYSMGAKLVDFVSMKFVFISLFGMIIILLTNQKEPLPADVLFYRNVRDIFISVMLMFVLQIVASFVVNKFINRLEKLAEGKHTKKPAVSRKKDMMWICDVLVIAAYLSAFIFALWYVGVDIQKYIFHDVLITIALVVFATILIYNAFKEFTDAMVDRAEPADHERILTLLPVISIAFNVTLVCISGSIILSKLGVAVIPLLASFTAVSAAVAVAAKDTVKGFLQGIILLFEKSFCIGDFISINGVCGVVIKISARTLTLRDVSGDIHVIPYDIVKVITNYSKEFFCHNEYLLVTPDTDVEKVSEILRQVVQQMRTEEQFTDKIYDDVKILGIKSFSPEGIRINWNLKTASSAAGRLVSLEIYKRLFSIFKDENIKVPYSQEYFTKVKKLT